MLEQIGWAVFGIGVIVWLRIIWIGFEKRNKDKTTKND